MSMVRNFQTHRLDRSALAVFDHPVYYALGARSNPTQFAEIAARLGNVFPHFTLEVFAERHHFDPPHRSEPGRLAESLLAICSRDQIHPAG